MSPALRRVTYGALGGLWLSGALWWGLERFGARPGPFGEEPHPWLPALLEGHGGLAMAGLLVLGAVWVLHVRRGWRARRHQRSGGALVAFLGILILTVWALYYVADERARAAATLVHVYGGLGLPAAVAFHVVRGRRQSR